MAKTSQGLMAGQGQMTQETGPQWQAVQGRTWAQHRHVGRREIGRQVSDLAPNLKGLHACALHMHGSWAVGSF